MWLLMSGLVIIALAAATLFIVSNTQRSIEFDTTSTQHSVETITSWCGTNVYNECFEPGCTPPPMSFGECRFYFLYEQDQRATRQAFSTPSP
jgi:hypothetical protein